MKKIGNTPAAVLNATVTPDCTCFQTCDLRGINHFLAHLPEKIHPGSPWVPYLRAVYGQHAPVEDIDLRSLSFFYHGTPPFSNSHPTLVWPMAQCEWHNFDLYRMQSRRCDSDVCSRWLAPTPREVPPLRRAFHTLADQSSNRTSGIAVFPDDGPKMAADDTWAEVMREDMNGSPAGFALTRTSPGSTRHRHSSGQNSWHHPYLSDTSQVGRASTCMASGSG